jgi:hypothetical protein
MNCYRHRDQLAVGTCKGCSKGLCTACSIDTGHALVCAEGTCQAEVRALQSQVTALRADRTAGLLSLYLQPIALLVFGVAIIWATASSRNPSSFSMAVGLTSVALSGLYFWVAYRRQRKSKTHGG